METPSQSSKVTVEYHDPSGVFPLVSRDIASRLPLRNLNWQSQNRPLRQIRSLHVDFVADKETEDTLRPSPTRNGHEGPNSLEIVRAGPDARKHAVKERRHQIPGFRTSPYLKVYVLRCDDKEIYKDAARRQIRDWIRKNAQPEGQTDHDAFEWMILHVVIPDTVAASEPRWREGTKDPDELKERKSGAKLAIGKSTRTVFDRLRADFNESGKTGQDRVAQVRLPKSRTPADLLPTPAVAETHEETADEQQKTWNDLIAKLKTLILGPFDRRVWQYESDIAEQEARRSMPGWNFCTFFIHKEGLAIALESIGLVEDALAIYDELSLGLELVLRDIAAGRTQGTATSFAAYTDDIKERITGQHGTETSRTSDEVTIDKREAGALFDKDYRERIVRSNISVFDFFCYLFVRQKSLTLRLANTRSARMQLEPSATKEGGEDLVLTSEVCWRTSNFIHNAARTLRQDLYTRAQHMKSSDSTSEVENLVSSWTWAVAGLILHETAAPALEAITTAHSKDGEDSTNGKPRRPSLTVGLGANTHPQRTTSLPANRSKHGEPQRPSSVPKIDEDSTTRPQTSEGLNVVEPTGLPGQAELATYRAELIVLRRKMLEQLGGDLGWYAGWGATKQERHGVMQPKEHEQVLCPDLKLVLHSQTSFEATFERLTNFAIRHYYAATQSKSAESLLGDLALLKFQQNDFETASTYFQHIIPQMASDSWNLMEVQALHAQFKCLQALKRDNGVVANGLAILAKVAARRQMRELSSPHNSLNLESDDDDLIQSSRIFADIIRASNTQQQDVIFPIKSCFGAVKLETTVLHREDEDSFSLVLKVQHLLASDFTFEELSARLVNNDDPALEVTLSSKDVTLTPGMNEVQLRANVVTYGAYLIDRIVFRARRLCFVEELRPASQPTALGFTEVEPPTVTIREPGKAPAFVYLYPATHALNAELRRSRRIHIDKPRHLEILLDSGRDGIDSLDIRLKPKSAGLRLHLSDATSLGVELQKADVSKQGIISLEPVKADHAAVVSVPYTVEHANRDISIHLDIQYRTKSGNFALLQSASLSNELPLDVDVNDIFHSDALFSNFTVRTTTRTPFSVSEAKLNDSAVYAVEAPPVLPLPLMVFRSQPLNLIYKIKRRQASSSDVLRRDAALALEVHYQPMNDSLLDRLLQTFSEALMLSDFAMYTRLLRPLLLERARAFVESLNLELVALMGEAEVPSFETVGWQDIICTLPEDVQEPLRVYLKRWHAKHETISIAAEAAEHKTPHCIVISVDVPNIDMVFNTSMALDLATAPRDADIPVITLGQPVRAIVNIKHTDMWSAKNLFPSVPTFRLQGEDETKTAFVCDIGPESDAWLIGGQRRCHFTPVEDIEHSFEILLVPLRTGIHPLPLVEVHQESRDPEMKPEDSSISLSCETHYESAGQVVHVVRELRTVKVQIMESAAAIALPPSRPGSSSAKEPG